MEQRTDSELMEILTKDRDEYQPEALKAAEAELEKRKLTVDQIESAKQEIKTKEQAINDWQTWLRDSTTSSLNLGSGTPPARSWDALLGVWKSMDSSMCPRAAPFGWWRIIPG